MSLCRSRPQGTITSRCVTLATIELGNDTVESLSQHGAIRELLQEVLRVLPEEVIQEGHFIVFHDSMERPSSWRLSTFYWTHNLITSLIYNGLMLNIAAHLRARLRTSSIDKF
mgnify:CR=1 FL=1